jgi:hypothetical protein
MGTQRSPAVIRWMELGFLALIAGALLALAAPAHGATAIPYSPTTHKAVFIMAVDDWVSQAFYDSAEAIGVPITWFIDPAENDEGGTEATRRALMHTAYTSGHDIAAHTSTAVTSSTTAAQARAIFAASKDWITNELGASPTSWTYYGNDWTAVSQSVIREYFPGLIRLRDTSSDASPTVPYRNGAAVYPDVPSGITPAYGTGPFPLAMYRLDQMVYTARLCTTCLSGGVDTDTSGTADMLDDLVATRGVAITSVHPTSDISATQFAWILRSGTLLRSDIWFCTAKQFVEQFGSALDEDNYGVIHAAPYGRFLGSGTTADPTPIGTALLTWGQVVQLKDTTYSVETLFGPSVDMVVKTNQFLRGPATIVLDQGGTGATASEVTMALTPTGSNYTGYWGGFRGVTFDMINSDYASSALDRSVNITKSSAIIDSCLFTGGASGECAQIHCNQANTDNVKIRWNTFALDTAGTCAGIERISGAGMSGWCIANNTFRCTTTGTKYGVYAAVALAADDSLLNNRFINGNNSSTFYGVRYAAANSATAPYYTTLTNGSEFVGTTAKCWLKSGAKTISTDGGAALDSLVASSSATWRDKMWFKTDTTVSDTTKFGGVPLSHLGAQTYWSSIGPTQYTGDLYIWPGAVSGRGTLRINGPWKLLQLINASVLPVSDSLTAATWYQLPRVQNESDATLVRSWFDAYEKWPNATRMKMRFAFDSHAMNITGAAATYNGPWALYAAIPGSETASDSLVASTWFTLPRPYNLTDALQLDFWLRCYRAWPDAMRKLIRFQVAGADLSFDGAVGHYGPWSAWAAIGTTETASDSLNPSTWFRMARVPPRTYAQLVQNRIYLDAIDLWPDSKRKQVRATTR